MNHSDARDKIRMLPDGKDAIKILFDEAIKRAESDLCSSDPEDPKAVMNARIRLEGAKQAYSRVMGGLYGKPVNPVLK